MQSVVILISACIFSFLLNKILLKFSKNFGVQSRQSQNIIRWGSTSKPTTGGIAFYITFLVGAIFLLITHPHLLTSPNRFLALFLSATLAFFIGFADDAYNTNPRLKFLGQVMCGLILLSFGIHIHFFNIWVLDAFMTVFWVVGIMNSVNMLDNMDGVTTSISLSIIAIAMGMLVIAEGITNMYYMFVAISGSLVGFLFLNWKPAKIYMGDTGSMYIGMVLAYAGIQLFWNIETTPDNISYIRRGIIPLMVFIVPIMDTSFVTYARLARGSSPFVGGKDHLTHHLAHVGVPESLVPVTLSLISVISGGLALYAYLLIPEWSNTYSILFMIYPIALVAFFFLIYKRGEKIGKMKDMIAEREKMRLERLAQERDLKTMNQAVS